MKYAILFLFLLFAAFDAGAQEQTTAASNQILQKPVAEDKKDATSVLDEKNEPPTQTQPAYVRPTSKVRMKRYVNGMVGPFALGRQVAQAGISTWRNSPEEWGTKWEGFGRRVASNFGKNAIKQTVKFGLDEALAIDSHFYRSSKKDVGSRLRNALISPFTARNKSGKRVFGVSNIAGTYGANIIAAEAWFPSRYSYKDGLKSGTISLGFNAAFNIFKEFIWKK
jgi:hypothetical protein